VVTIGTGTLISQKGKPIVGGEDHEICNIDDYRYWAEYLYHIQGIKIYFRPLKAWYPESLKKAPDFRLLTEKEAEKYYILKLKQIQLLFV
jgi:hypothetical protein